MTYTKQNYYEFVGNKMIPKYRMIRNPSYPKRNPDDYNRKPSRHSCVYCGSKYRITRDHMIPRIFKKRYYVPDWVIEDPRNIVLACWNCNIIKKKDKLPLGRDDMINRLFGYDAKTRFPSWLWWQPAL